MKPSSRPIRHSRQRGAVSVLFGIALVAMLVAVMLAVEIGRMYAAHRQLQSLAAMAALDGVRVVGGCDRIAAPTAGEVNDGVRDSLVRQGEDADALLGTGSAVDLGYMRTIDNLRQLQVSSAEEASAVGITLTQPFPEPFLALWPYDPATLMVARAEAAQEVIGTISVGTTLLTIDSSRAALLDSLLSGMLGGAVSLSVASYQGLASADLTLLELAAAAGVATPGDLLALETDLPGALQIIGDALAASGEGTESTLQGTLASLAGVVDPNRNEFTFGDVLRVEDGVEDLVDRLPVNTLELLMALSESAAAGYPLTLPLSVSIPGISTVNLTARIGQARQIALGRPGYLEDGSARTVAHTSQIMLQLETQVLDVLSLLPVGGALLNLSLVAEVAPATATLTEVRCAYSGRPRHEATVDYQTGIATIAIGRYNSLAAANPMILAPGTLLNVPGLLRITVNDPVVIDIGNDSGAEEFEGPFVPAIETLDPAHVRTVGDAGAILDGAVDDLSNGLVQEVQFSGLLGVALQALSDAATLSLLNSLLSPLWTLVDVVLEDLLGLLGAELGTATVAIESVVAKQPEVFNTGD